MWHNAMLLAAALLLAACDSSAGTGDNPDPTMKTDASNPGKGDDPSQPDATVLDSGEDTDNNTTADPDSATLDTTSAPEQVCPSLLSFKGKWYRQNKDETLMVSVESKTDSDCSLIAERSTGTGPGIPFEGSAAPLSADVSDPSTPAGYVTVTLMFEDSLLKLMFNDNNGTTWTICYERR